MSNQPRQDDHRPSAICPDDYTYVACECVKIEGLGDCLFIQQQREIINRHMARTGGHYSTHIHGGNCHICGSVNMIYSILYYHEKTNSYMRCGEDCAYKLDLGGAARIQPLPRCGPRRTQGQGWQGQGEGNPGREPSIPEAWEIYEAKPVSHEASNTRRRTRSPTLSASSSNMAGSQLPRESSFTG